MTQRKEKMCQSFIKTDISKWIGGAEAEEEEEEEKENKQEPKIPPFFIRWKKISIYNTFSFVFFLFVRSFGLDKGRESDYNFRFVVA